MASAVVATGTVDLGSPPEDVWPLLTDTDRTNRLILPHPVEFRPIESDKEKGTDARFVASTSAAGFRLSYEEAPFEWTHGRAFSIERTMRTGPLKKYALSWTLEPLDIPPPSGPISRAVDARPRTGTRATIRLELVPRSFLLWPIAWLNAKRFVATLVHLAQSIDHHVKERAPSPYLKPVSPVDDAHLWRAVEELKKAGVDDELAERVGAFVGTAADADVVRIRPFELADSWGEDRRAVLRAFLRAVPAGLVELRWGLLCPSCMTASEQLRALEDIGLEGHCQLCDLSFDLDLDRAVEATFLVHPSVRKVPETLFCIGGPARTPHVLVQARLAPGEAKALRVPDAAGRYRLFARGGAVATIDAREGAPAEADAIVDGARVRPAHVEILPGGVLRVTSEVKEPLHVKIERTDFANAAATAHVVTTMGDFRQLFSSDLLKRGTPLKVARAAILFSDLTGSTALYSRVGDAAAFRLVDDHFDVVRGAIDAHGGAVVKTMGDAVMASFTDAREAAKASVDVLARFEVFRAKAGYGDEIGIKLGMHVGPCYVVTANGQLDYFGQTVNVASRVQHLAASGELVMTRASVDLLPEPIRSRLVVGEEFEARVKGVDEPLHLVRVRLRPS